MTKKKRCFWCDLKDKEYVAYHDLEWGKPVHDDSLLFEMLILECFQAGLSWPCVLHKRKAFREAFKNFDAKKVALFTQEYQEKLYNNQGIIRNKLKIKASVLNAQIFLKIQQEFSSFDAYIWQNKTPQNYDPYASTSPLAQSISKDLKKRGMKFVGPTIIHAYLCAIGIFNAHEETCFLKSREIHGKK